MNDFQALGAVEQLIPDSETEFAYPEFAAISTLLSDGATAPNFVLQSAAPSARVAAVAWAPVELDDVETIRGYHEAKTNVAFVQEDGTSRIVVVMDFASRRGPAGTRVVTVTLLETEAPGEGS